MDKFVDVSSCEWSRQIDLDINIICTLNSSKKHSSYCKDNPNCVFKQLKRKEQECERLKHDNDYEVGTLEKTIDNLTAENEKYEQNLTEIKKIAKSFCNACKEFEPEKIDRNCMYCNYGKILQKIKECEVK